MIIKPEPSNNRCGIESDCPTDFRVQLKKNLTGTTFQDYDKRTLAISTLFLGFLVRLALMIMTPTHYASVNISELM